MTIIEMSISASLFILAAAVIRALTLYKLPSRSYQVMWGIALFLLFVPLRPPSPVSVFSLFREEAAAGPLPITALTGGNYGSIPQSSRVYEYFSPAAEPAASFRPQISPWSVVWPAGIIACALFFLVTHIRCRRRYQMSLPCGNPAVSDWLAAHRLQRNIGIRISDQISAPLTYGIIRPVILLPAGLDGGEQGQLEYVLTHEWIHIKRFDVAFKALLAAAICLHWFNPLVWQLFFLAGRDLELACDEAVIRVTGTDRRRDYAMTLLQLEERKNRFAPLCTSFSKNGLEERVKGILKWRKTTAAGIILALMLITVTGTVFATRALPGDQVTMPSDKPTPAAPQSSATVTAGSRRFPQAQKEAGNHSGYLEADYAVLMAMMTEHYREESLASFHARLGADAGLYSGYNLKDENLDFLVTLSYAAAEVIAAEYQEIPEEWASAAVNHNMDTTGYYGAEMDYTVSWTVADPARMTVGQRDDVLNQCHNEIIAVLDRKTAAELSRPDIMRAVQQECDALAGRLSDQAMHLSVFVQGINSAAGDADFAVHEYPLLVSLRPEGFEAMTVNEFRTAVLMAMDAEEERYQIELDRAFRDNRLDRIRYTDPDAAFILNTLAPLTAGQWERFTIGGFFTDEAGMAEYRYTVEILDAGNLSMKDYDGVWKGMAAGINAVLQSAPASALEDPAGMRRLLETAANSILSAEHRGIRLTLDYIDFMEADEEWQ